METFARRPASDEVDLLLFPECFLQGYLVESEHISKYALDLTATSFQKILDRLSPIRPTLVFGVIEQCGAAYFNTAVVVRHGMLEGFYRKTHLVPGERLFQAGNAYPTFNLNGVTCGINICYDTNFPEAAKAVAAQGARVLLVPSQNMMRLQTAEEWKCRHNAIRAERVRETGMWLVSADVVDSIYDGRFTPTVVKSIFRGVRSDVLVTSHFSCLEVESVAARMRRGKLLDEKAYGRNRPAPRPVLA